MKHRALLWAVSQMLRWLEHEAHQLHLVPRLRMHGSPVHMQRTLSCIILPALPTNKILSSLCLLNSLASLPGVSCLGSLGVGWFSGQWKTPELDYFGFWTSDIHEIATSCRKFSYFTSVFNVRTQK